jgi:hypothetical protein
MGIETLGIMGLGTTLLGGVTQMIGQKQAAAGSADMYRYQAQIAQNDAVIQQRNQELAGLNASYAEDQGVRAEQDQIRKARGLLGAQTAAFASNNITVNEGSAVDVQDSTASLSKLGFAAIRDSAARQAAGYRIQGLNAQTAEQDDLMRSQMYSKAAGNTQRAGNISLIGSIIGTGGKLFDRYSDMSATGVPFNDVSVVS